MSVEARELVQDVYLQRCDLTKFIGSINKFLWRKSMESHVNDTINTASAAATYYAGTNNKGGYNFYYNKQLPNNLSSRKRKKSGYMIESLVARVCV